MTRPASERLRERAKRFDYVVAFNPSEVLALADVVEAAEGEWAAWDDCGYPEDLGPETRKLRDSLTALGEALEDK